MNEEILKEAVIYSNFIGYHWREYTFEQLEKRMREMCSACRIALGKIKKSHITDFERGAWLLIQARIVQKLEDVQTVEMIELANFSKQKMIDLEKDCGGLYLQEVENFINISME